MMMGRWRRLCAFALSAAFLVLFGCTKEQCDDGPPTKPVETSDILLQKQAVTSQPFGVDICIDATPSMDGFAADPNSTYRAFLEDLEGSLVSGVKNVSDLRFYKFGEKLRQMTREEFRSARNKVFYHEPGIFRDTNIELVFNTRSDDHPQPPLHAAASPPRRVIVVVTDLFQKDQDVNVVIQQIKNGCLTDPNCSVGILPISSSFDGMVYDARVPTYPYRTTADPASFRPFYLLMFGPEEELMRFADVLSARRYVDLNHLLVAGPRIVSSFTADVVRDPSGQGVGPRKSTGWPLDSSFNLRKGNDEAKVIARIRTTRAPGTFDYSPTAVSVSTFRDHSGKRVPAEREFSVDSVARLADALEIHSTIRPPIKKCEYTYVAEVSVGDVKGFVVPRWVSEFSSTNPTPEHEPAKTLNLDRFVEELIAASVLQEGRQPTLARYRIVIKKF